MAYQLCILLENCIKKFIKQQEFLKVALTDMVFFYGVKHFCSSPPYYKNNVHFLLQIGIFVFRSFRGFQVVQHSGISFCPYPHAYIQGHYICLS